MTSQQPLLLLLLLLPLQLREHQKLLSQTVVALLLMGCTVLSTPLFSIEISGRRSPSLYSFEVPHHFKQVSHTQTGDTTKPIAEFLLDDIRITVHNFPVEKPEDRVAPIAQLERWKRQIGKEGKISPQAFSGFVGLCLEASNDTQAVLGWSLQLGNELYNFAAGEMRADVTIKAMGDKEAIEEKREEITAFARSFSLTRPIDYE